MGIQIMTKKIWINPCSILDSRRYCSKPNCTIIFIINYSRCPNITCMDGYNIALTQNLLLVFLCKLLANIFDSFQYNFILLNIRIVQKNYAVFSFVLTDRSSKSYACLSYIRNGKCR